MAGKFKTTDAQVEATREIYRVAREEADIELKKLRSEMEVKGSQREAMGILKKIHHDRAYNNLIEAVVLFRIKENKLYKEGGLNWEDFCEAINIDRREADRIITDIRPIFERFSDNLSSFLGVTFNKIRYLGKVNPDNLSSFVTGDPEETEALIDKLKGEILLQKEEFTAQKKAHERVQADLHKTIVKLEKNLIRSQGVLADSDLSDEEAAFMKQMEALRLAFDGLLINADPENIEALALERDPSPRIRAAIISTIYYMRMEILKLYDVVEQTYGDAIMNPEQSPFATPAFKLVEGADASTEGKQS